MERLEAALANLSLFENLRPDEVGRIAKHFQYFELTEGEGRCYGGDPSEARLVVLVSGRAALEMTVGERTLIAHLDPGDRIGDTGLVSGHVHPFTIRAVTSSALATLDRAGLDAVLREFPAVALPLADDLSRALRAKNDAVRQLLELHAERLPREQLASAIAERRKVLGRRRMGVARTAPRAIFRRLVVNEGDDPPFWILTGFLVALGLARLVVFLILKYHLEEQLFALVKGLDPNPMHVHHFNYGLLLVGTSGLAALFPMGRRVLRILAFVFGAGCGLVFDEFSLFWNLNPEYANPASLIASAIAVTVLVQITYFRRYWYALARRAWLGLRGWR